MPSVSVVMPLFNKEAYVVQAIGSVAAQSHADFELIVVNDASGDCGAELARRYPDPRVRVIDLAVRSGAAVARNAGILAARAPLIAFIDADDLWEPHFLKTMLSLYRRYPHAGLFAAAYDTQRRGVKRRVRIRGLPRGRFEGLMPNYFKSVLGPIPVISSAVMIPRAVFSDIGLFAPGRRLGEDQDMWCRVALKYPVAYSVRRCAVYRLGVPDGLCESTTVTEPYPVMCTVRRALAEHPQYGGWLRRYFAKLSIDYAVHLIRGFALAAARAALKAAGFWMPGHRLRAEYYFLRAAWDCRRRRA